MNAEKAEQLKPAALRNPDAVWVERVSTRQLNGYNQRGVEIPIGLEPGRISPGELLKLALIGCAGMSMDHAASRRLGENFALRITADGTVDPQEDRYQRIDERILMDLQGLNSDERAALETVIGRVIDAACTIKRTVQQSADVHHTIIDVASEDAVHMEKNNGLS